MKIFNEMQSNPLISGWLVTYYGFSSVAKWIENIVIQLLDATNQTFPPIQLEPIMRLRKFIGPPIGYVYNKWETRFTIAHEIAHTFFYNLSTSPPYNTFPAVPRHVSEALCNKIATEILMPKKMVENSLKRYSFMTDNCFNIQLFRKIVLNFVNQFNVSPNVVTRRLVENFNLWSILVLGVGWRSSFPKKEVIKLGKLEIEESGFSIKLFKKRKYELNMNQNYKWRVEWYAKPLWALNDLFVPSIGNPSVHLNIVEDLYNSSKNNYFLESKESLKAFRLGNLTKYLKKIYGIKENYPVFACFFKKSLENGMKLPLETQNYNDDLYKRRQSKIILCIPLKILN